MRHVSGTSVLILLVVAMATSPLSFAQMDLAGEWGSTFHEDLPHRGGMRLGDYTGLPLNEAGFRKAASWDETARSTRERQCIPHVATYAMRGPATIRFSKVVDPDSGDLIAYSLVGSYGRPRMIWMDGRPHPSDLAPHTWAGFSTGRWERNTLVAQTTHIKTGWLQRNGAPTSDLATMTEHFIRHGDHLMLMSFVKDPVFLDEPMVRTTNYVASPTSNANAWGPCGPAQIIDELPGVPKSYVAHYLPDHTAHIDDFVATTGVPAEGARGGGATLYPEFAETLRRMSDEDTLAPAHRPLPDTARVERIAEAVPAMDDVRVVPVQGNVFMLAGAGGNMAVQVGDDGVLVVDSGDGSRTDSVLAAIRELSDRPIRFLINTHAHPDHIGGNDVIARAGRPLGGGRVVSGPSSTGAAIVAHETVLMTLSAPFGEPSLVPVAAWPTVTYPDETKEVFTNGEAIQLLHQPAAHTDGDSLVFFRRSDVLVTGDIVDLTAYPMIDVENGGSLTGLIDALNRIIEVAIPKAWEEGGTMIIPGSGRVADEADVAEYRDTITIVRDRIEEMVSRGMTLEEVQAARPTFEYDARYGTNTGPWTTEMFVEVAYGELSRQ